MSLRQKIQDDLMKAVKEKDEVKLLVLRQLFSSLTNKEKEKKYKLSKESSDSKEGFELQEDEVLEVLAYEAKKRKEAMVEFEKGKRDDLVAKEKKELAVLEVYLPEQLSREEIEQMAKEAVTQLGASSVKDMGKVMGVLSAKTKGRADGAVLSAVVKELLGK